MTRKFLDHLQLQCICGKQANLCEGVNCLGKGRCRECGGNHILRQCSWARGKGENGWQGKEEARQLSQFLVGKRICVFCLGPRGNSRIKHHKGKEHTACSLSKRLVHAIINSRLSITQNAPSHGCYLRQIFEDNSSFNKFCSEQHTQMSQDQRRLASSSSLLTQWRQS